MLPLNDFLKNMTNSVDKIYKEEYFENGFLLLITNSYQDEEKYFFKRHYRRYQ